MPKWRSGSEFGTGRRVPLDREQRAVFRAKLRLNRRPGRLSITAVTIADIMLNMIGADGRLDPSIATLAELARVEASTVIRCLGRLKACGFVEWMRRLVRCAAGGWRVEQASNAYVLTVPVSDTHFASRVSVRPLPKRQPWQTNADEWDDQETRRRNAHQFAVFGLPIPTG